MRKNFVIFTLPGIVAFIHTTPVEIKTMAFFAFWLTVSDFFFGVVTSWVCKEFRSSRMRLKWCSKIGIYYVCVILSCLATILFGYYQTEVFTLGIIIACEVSSHVEKLIKMQQYSGLPMGLLDKFLSVIAPGFDISYHNPGSDKPDPGQTVVRHTAIISNDPREPEIHFSETETIPLHRPKVLVERKEQNVDTTSS